MERIKTGALGLTLAGLALAAGCGEAGTGSVEVLIEAEETLLEGIPAGPEGEAIADGWEVVFDSYLLVVGEVELGHSTDSARAVAPERARAYDLSLLDPAVPHARFEGLAARRWDRLAYTTPVADAETQCAQGVTPADCARLADEGLTYLIRGRIEKADGQSCPPPEGLCHPASVVAFELAVAAPTRYASCEDNGVGGVAVPEGGQVAASLTLHGDHLFFNAFPGAAEEVVRRAQWLANADLDQSGAVDMAELAQIPNAQFVTLFTAGTTLSFEDAYSFAGAPLPLTDASRYVAAQLSTQGHLNGEGECAFELL